MKKIIGSLALISLLSACSSVTTEQKFKDSVAETSDSIMFNFKDPIEQYTYLIYKNDDALNPKAKQAIVKTCHLNKEGVSEKDFLMFAKYDPKNAKACLDKLANYKHPSFLVEGSVEQKTHIQFLESVPIYTDHFFGIPASK